MTVQTHEDSTKNCEVTDKKDSAIKNPEKSNSVEALAEADQQIHLVKSEKNPTTSKKSKRPAAALPPSDVKINPKKELLLKSRPTSSLSLKENQVVKSSRPKSG